MNNKLKQLRIENNKTLSEIAAILKITTSAYAHYEQGIREPSIETLIKLANHFNCTVDYLIGRESEDGVIIISNASKSKIEEIYEKLNHQNQIKALGYLTGLLDAQ